MNKVNIIIPTYNRKKSLIKTLNFLADLISYGDNVAIYVIDNHSDDGTKESLEELQSVGILKDQLIIHRNEKNIGLDGSILYAAENILSNESMSWFLSDDDILDKSGVLSFIDFLKQTEKQMVVARFDNPQFRYEQLKPREIYLRGSFLSSLALRGSVDEEQLPLFLQGTNYIHLGIINLIVNDLNQIALFEKKVGIQAPNMQYRFKYFETFVLGYGKCLLFNNQVLNRSEAKAESLQRAQHYLVNGLMDYYSNLNCISFSFKLKYVKDVIAQFKFDSLKLQILLYLRLLPKLIGRVLFRKRVNAYIDSKERQRIILNKLRSTT